MTDEPRLEALRARIPHINFHSMSGVLRPNPPSGRTGGQRPPDLLDAHLTVRVPAPGAGADVRAGGFGDASPVEGQLRDQRALGQAAQIMREVNTSRVPGQLTSGPGSAFRSGQI